MLRNGPEREVVDPGAYPAPRGRSGFEGLAQEGVLIAFAMLLVLRDPELTVGNVATAFANADRIVALEHDLGVDREDALQSAAVSSDALVTLANWVYIFGHWPVILGVATALYVYRRRHYYLLRNAMFASGLIGFLFFALFPVAPPRLLDLGLADTVTERSDAYRALQPPGLTNQYAAFPSLHAGWNLLVAIVVVMAVTSLALRAVALVLPVAMALAVVVTANHFVIDIAGGVVVSYRCSASRFSSSDARMQLPSLSMGSQGTRGPPAGSRRRSSWRIARGTASTGCMKQSDSASHSSRPTSACSTDGPRSGT